MKKIIFIFLCILSLHCNAQSSSSNSSVVTNGGGGYFAPTCTIFVASRAKDYAGAPDYFLADTNNFFTTHRNAGRFIVVSSVLAQQNGAALDSYLAMSGCSCPSGYTMVRFTVGSRSLDSCQQNASSSSSASSTPSCTITESCSSSSASSLPYCSQVQAPALCTPDPASSSASSSASSTHVIVGSGSSSPSSSVSSSTGSTGSGGSGGSTGGLGDIPIAGEGLGITNMQSCELTFGAGHCSVIAANSPCPNSMTVGGQTFCVTLTSSNGTGNGTGTSTSEGSGTDTGTGEVEGEGECDPESSDYLQCATPEGGDSPEHTQTASGLNSVDDVNKNFTDRLGNSPIVSSMGVIKNIVTLSSASCPDFTIHIFNRDITTTMHCTLWALIAVVLSPIMLAIWSIVAFRIFASA